MRFVCAGGARAREKGMRECRGAARVGTGRRLPPLVSFPSSRPAPRPGRPRARSPLPLARLCTHIDVGPTPDGVPPPASAPWARESASRSPNPAPGPPGLAAAFLRPAPSSALLRARPGSLAARKSRAGARPVLHGRRRRPARPRHDLPPRPRARSGGRPGAGPPHRGVRGVHLPRRRGSGLPLRHRRVADLPCRGAERAGQQSRGRLGPLRALPAWRK